LFIPPSILSEVISSKEQPLTFITVPTRETVSEANQAIFDQLQKSFKFVPNLFATFALSDTALGTYLALQNAKSSLSAKEREIIYLVVSQVNACQYCLAAHTMVGKMLGFTDAQIIEMRQGIVSFDPRLDALAKFVKAVAVNRGHIGETVTKTFLEAGWREANLVDVILAIGDKTITNYLHSVTEIPVDFPAAPAI
jgi:uncharacterized peroxidase-related enzyme